MNRFSIYNSLMLGFDSRKKINLMDRKINPFTPDFCWCPLFLSLFFFLFFPLLFLSFCCCFCILFLFGFVVFWLFFILACWTCNRPQFLHSDQQKSRLGQSSWTFTLAFLFILFIVFLFFVVVFLVWHVNYAFDSSCYIQTNKNQGVDNS